MASVLPSSWLRLLSRGTFVLAAVLAIGLGACASSGGSTKPGATLPHFDHILVVVEENHSYSEIIGSGNAPYINSLAMQDVLFTASHAVAHPSEPNYLALFAGSTFGLTSDACPRTFTAANLGSELLAQKLSFTGYAEDLPSAGFTGCSTGDILDPVYARKHAPWVNFSNVPSASNQPLTAFPANLASLPTVAFVIPNQRDDMHSGSIATADSWLKSHLDAYVQWAPAHNSLLIVTWDEDDNSSSNQISTIFVGAHLKAGKYSESITHYTVLRTIEALNGIAFSGSAASASTITDVWQS